MIQEGASEHGYMAAFAEGLFDSTEGLFAGIGDYDETNSEHGTECGKVWQTYGTAWLEWQVC
jgi:hypothetical protein